MATTINKNCIHFHVDPTDSKKNFFGNNFNKVIHKDGHIYGCDRGCFKDDHCNSRCPFKQINRK
jgi:hypothetical protein